MLRRLGIIALMPLAVGACADLAFLEPIPAESGTRAPADENVAAPNPADQIFWGLTPRVVDQTASVAVGEPPKPRRKPSLAEPVARAEPDPELLVGLDFEATKALLGDPALKMEQPPAKIWAYNGGTCMFAVFFYPSMDDSVFRVLTYEATGKEPQTTLQPAARTGDTGTVKIRDRANPALRRCFADLLSGRDVPNAG